MTLRSPQATRRQYRRLVVDFIAILAVLMGAVLYVDALAALIHAGADLGAEDGVARLEAGR